MPVQMQRRKSGIQRCLFYILQAMHMSKVSSTSMLSAGKKSGGRGSICDHQQSGAQSATAGDQACTADQGAGKSLDVSMSLGQYGIE